MKIVSYSWPLLGSFNINFRSDISLGSSFRTSPIRMPPRAISSSIRRFLVLDVRNMISSTVSLSRTSHWYFTFGLYSLCGNGESQGFIIFVSRLFFTKLKNADRLANRQRLVWGLRPLVSLFRKSIMSSIVRSPKSWSANWWHSGLMSDEWALTAFFFRVVFVVIHPNFSSFKHFHDLPPLG